MQEQSELQTLLKSYLKERPQGAKELAEEFEITESTITRWANGVSHPYPQVAEKVIAILKTKMQTG